MASSELNALTAATAATGGIYYGEQSGASRKFTVTAAGATLLEAANAAAQRTALGLATGDSPQFTALNIGAATWTPTANTTALTVASATHTSSAPILDAAQTWNAGGTTFTAVKLNVTNTASAAGSLLMDLQVGSASKFNVTKAGLIAATSSLELYNTAIDGTNYEKLTIDWSSNVLRIAPRSGGTGTGRGMTVGANNLPGYGYIHFAANGNVGFGTTGPSVNYEFGATWGCADAVNIVLGSTNGTKIGTATTQKIGFFNATPVIQQTANASIIDNTGGTPTTTFDACGDTTSSNQAGLINNVFGGIAAELNKIRTLITNLGLGA